MDSSNLFLIPRRPVSGLATPSHSKNEQREDGITVNHLSPADIHNSSNDSDPSIRLLRSPDASFHADTLGDSGPSIELKPLGPRTTLSLPYNNRTRNKERDGINWMVPTMAVLIFLLGVLAAAGHHIFLSRLNGKPNNNQKWIGRYSLALAFTVKVSFAAAIAEALNQRIWYSVRHNKRGISVTGIDAILTIQQAPLGFLNFEIWRSATLPVVLGSIIWTIPLLAVVTQHR